MNESVTSRSQKKPNPVGSGSAGHLEAVPRRMTGESNITSSISRLPECKRPSRPTVFCHCNDLFSATAPLAPLTPPCEQLLLSRVFAPNTVTPGPFPEQMKMDTLNLIPDEISPRLARGPVFKSRWRPHTGQPADQRQWRAGWRVTVRSLLLCFVF